MKKILLLIMTIPTLLFSQNYPGLGTWNVLNVRKNINQNYSIWAEGQIRSLETYNKFHYEEIKAGVTYKVNNSLNFSINAGKYKTYTLGGNFESPVTTDETRIWEEVNYRTTFGRFINDQRIRVEQRFINTYSNRYRYRNSITIPLNHKTLDNNTCFVNLYDEIFIIESVPFLNRNRIYYGVGYKFKNETIQVGYVKQFDQKTTTNWVKNYLVAQLSISI